MCITEWLAYLRQTTHSADVECLYYAVLLCFVLLNFVSTLKVLGDVPCGAHTG